MPSLKVSQALFLVLIAAALFLMGCDEMAPLNLSLSPVASLRVSSGVLVPQGTEIPLSFVSAGTEPDRIVIELVDANGNVYDFELLQDESRTAADEVWSFLLPDSMNDGLWSVDAMAWNGDELLASTRSEFFVSQETWSIWGIDLYPPKTLPGNSVIAQAVLDVPEGSDPFLRWHLDGELLAEGLVSQGAMEQILTAGERTGGYSLELCVFPDESAAHLEAPVVGMSTLFVDEVREPDIGDLGPLEHYDLVMHFLGNLDNAAESDDGPGNPQVQGLPMPVLLDGRLGYAFDEDDHLVWETFSWPRTDRGEWAPFTLVANLRVLTEGSIFRIETPDALELSWSYNSSGDLVLILSDGWNLRESALSLPTLWSQSSWVAVSVEPGPSFWTLTWLVDGDTQAVELWPSPSIVPPLDDAVAVLGDGFSGEFAEFAIYRYDTDGSPSVLGDHFSFVQRELHSHDLILAEGFEDGDLEESLVLSPGAAIENGALVLSPGATVAFPAQVLLDETLAITMALQSGGSQVPQGIFTARQGYDGAVVSRQEFLVDASSEYRFATRPKDFLSLEKTTDVSDNEREVLYEFTASTRNETVLRLNHILVTRD